MYTIGEIKKIIEEDHKTLNFTVMSDVYPHLSSSRIIIKCNKCSTAYKKTVAQITKMTGCHECLNRYHYDDIVKLVYDEYKQYDLTLLSETFPDPLTNRKFRLQCNVCKHEFKRDVTDFKRSYGCPKCKHKSLGVNRQFTLDQVKEILKKHGYELIGNYTGSANKTQVKCKNGHKTYKYMCDLVRNKSITCTKCITGQTGISEEICRAFFEYLFDVPFDRCSPSWLVNPTTNGRLILDGYNDTLKLGFEYNGINHYKFTEHFHKTYGKYMESVINDCEKIVCCYKNNIKLITVPYTVKYENMLNYIKIQCTKIGIKFKDKLDINVSDLNLSNGKISYYNKRIDEYLKGSAHKRIENYSSSSTKLLIECISCKHQLGVLFQNIIKYNYNVCKKCKYNSKILETSSK